MTNWSNKIRRTICEKFGIWDIWDLLPYRCCAYYYDNIKPIFFPRNKKIRKVIPRAWADVTSLIVDVNFAMIKQFYEDEYLLGFIDWEGSSEGHKKFEEWLKEAYTYICHKRPSLNAEMERSYPPLKPIEEMFKPITDEKGRKMYEMVDDGIPYHEKYKDVIRLEKEITDTDTKFLKQMVEYREYFWT
jgi:hypothetical protein